MSDGLNWKAPRAPKRYFDGSPITFRNDLDHCPQGQPIQNLMDPDVYADIEILNRKEKTEGGYTWHRLYAWNYCHFHGAGRNWYGWRTGDEFHWVLWKGGRYWWRDTKAKRWLSFFKGYWWWQSGVSSPVFQVLWTDGNYHACGADGTLKDFLGGSSKHHPDSP